MSADNITDFREIAKQLSNPEGERGIETGKVMEEGNAMMCKKAIDGLCLMGNESILEIGHGNAAHVSYLFSVAKNLRYEGIDISPTMVQEAKFRNRENPFAQFSVSNGIDIPFSKNYFDAVFTVNTLYFWGNPLVQLKEIQRVLKPEGKFSLAIRSKDFMQNLPFTAYGFKLYNKEDVFELLVQSGFDVVDMIQEEEKDSLSIIGSSMTKDYIVVTSTAKA